jgi:hypothetical protein
VTSFASGQDVFIAALALGKQDEAVEADIFAVARLTKKATP